MNKEILLLIVSCIVGVVIMAIIVVELAINFPANESNPPSDEHTWYNATYRLTSHIDMNVSVQLVISAGDWANYSDPVVVAPGATCNFTVTWPDVREVVVLVYVFDQSNYVRFIRWYIYEPDMVASQVVQ